MNSNDNDSVRSGASASASSFSLSGMMPAIDESWRNSDDSTPRTPEEAFLSELLSESGGGSGQVSGHGAHAGGGGGNGPRGGGNEASFSDFLSGDAGEADLDIDTFSL